MSATRSKTVGGMAAAAAIPPLAWEAIHLTAPVATSWRAGAGQERQVGRLGVRVAGNDSDEPREVVLLLHGLLSSGDIYGREFDRVTDGMLVVPDLLGFGRSMSHDLDQATLDDHLDALEAVLDGLGLTDTPLVIGGHSLGGLLAIHLAQRRRHQLRRLVTWCAPLHDSTEEARASISSMGVLARLFALDERISRRSCAYMCRHRDLARMVAVAASPHMPVPIARRTVEHTWPAYRDAVALIRDSPWPRALDALLEDGSDVTLLRGGDDVVTAGPSYDRLGRSPGLRVITVPGADHHLPLKEPTLSARSLSSD